MHKFQKRIKFSGKVKSLLSSVSRSYKLGSYVSHKVVPVGYEDFNLILRTVSGNYFVKIFASYRSKENCKRYVEIIRSALAKRVKHPKILRSSRGFLYQVKLQGTPVFLCIMEYIDGKSLYDLRADVIHRESRFLIKQAALINQIKLKPKFIYDSWAVSNFLKEYKGKRQYLDSREKRVLDSLANRFSQVKMRKLPHCLVHGDIIKTNVMRNRKGRLFIIDFSVANYYPRIQELAVLLCSIIFDDKHPENIGEQRHFALSEYQKYVPLTDYELKEFPLYCDVAHAMHVLQATYQKKVDKNTSRENEYWLKLGRIGLSII